MNQIPTNIRYLEKCIDDSKTKLFALSAGSISTVLIALVMAVAYSVILAIPLSLTAIPVSCLLLLTGVLLVGAHYKYCEMKTAQKHLNTAYRTNIVQATIIECWTKEVDMSQQAAATLKKNNMIDTLLALSGKAYNALWTISDREMKTFIELPPASQKKVLEIIDGTDLESDRIEFLIDMISSNSINGGHLTPSELTSMTDYRTIINNYPSNIVRDHLSSEESHQWVEKWKARCIAIDATKSVYPNLRTWIETPRPTQQIFE